MSVSKNKGYGLVLHETITNYYGIALNDTEHIGRLSVTTTNKAEDAPITIRDECKTVFSEEVTSF